VLEGPTGRNSFSTFRVVGIRGDGTREVRASNLLKATAEALKALMESWSEYDRVVVEPSRRRRTELLDEAKWEARPERAGCIR